MGHMFNIGLYRKNHEKILSETIWLKPGSAVVECLTRDREAAGLEPHWRHCIVVLQARHIYPSSVLVHPRKTRLCLTERFLMERKESNQTNKQNKTKNHMA